MKLQKILSDVQTVCEAIASVVNIDVTIVDDHLVRIAGTGRYKDSIGKMLSNRSAFHYALKERLAFVIENPGTHQACLNCDCKDKCSEHAEMCCPIENGDQVVGVIGLIAFEGSQRKALIENKDNLMVFLNKMAELIASQLREYEAKEALEVVAKEIEVAIDSVDTGFLVVDQVGRVIRYNRKIKALMGKQKIQELSEIFDEETVSALLASQKPLKNGRIRFDSGIEGVYDVAPVRVKDVIKGHVLTLTPLEVVLKTVNDMTQDGITTTFSDIVGDSELLRDIKAMAEKVAHQKSTVLILGESGTGKELFARAIHNASPRRSAPFVTVNCAAIPDALLESEMFGYEEGAFTGAKRGGKPGKFLLASGGTLFLDEIGDMPLHLQSKLLRVLQEQVVEPIGATIPVPVDVRVVAATHQNLEAKVLEGAFRQDLFYRLNVIPLSVPPLRQRMVDLNPLVTHFVKHFNMKLGKRVLGLSQEAMAALFDYSWPGNVRELENVLEYAINMCDQPQVDSHHLPKKLSGDSESSVTNQKTRPIGIKPICALEKEAIENALFFYKGDKEAVQKAAKALGLGRATLYRKIKQYGIE